jgi:hypothetical protein
MRDETAIFTDAPPAPSETEPRDGGVTVRVIFLCLCLAAIFGYIIPIIDNRFSNTYLGAAHLPPGAIAVLLIVLLVLNPLAGLAAQRSGVRGTVLTAALVLGVLCGGAFWLWGITSLLFWLSGALSILFLLAFGLGRRPLSRNESLTVYITCLFSCLVPGHGSENFFVSNIIGPYYFANAENKWLDFLRVLPDWFTPAHSGGKYVLGTPGYDALQGWYNGSEAAIPWAVWIGPLAAWSALILVSYVMLACLSVMLRAQWAQREALAFPLLRVPLEMTETGNESTGMAGPLFRNNLLWIGVGIAVFIQIVNGLHVYFPDVPEVPLQIKGNFFTENPWNQIGVVQFYAILVVIGITYLLTSEVSFSLWSFYWIIKIQLIVAYFLGFIPATLPNAIGSTGGAKTFTGYQQVGCYLAYVLILMWMAREHLAHIVRRAFGRIGSTPEEKQEAMSYPAAFWGFVLSFCFIIGWTIFAGVNPVLAIALWLSYLVIAIALTRVVAEAGLLFVQQGWLPLGTFAQITGAGAWMAPPSLVPASIMQGGLMTDLRAFVMPSFLQSFKLARDRGLKARPLLALITAVILITYGLGLWVSVRMGYENGGLSLNSWYAQAGAYKPAGDAASLMNNLRDVSAYNLIWLGVGMAMTYGMMLARSRLLWFPFHPVGLLMCLTYPMHRLWFSIFIGWLCKTIITKFGGSNAYRKLIPLFLGLVLGDVAMMIFWLIIDGWQSRIGHQLMPG